jgi:hypothetical protein
MHSWPLPYNGSGYSAQIDVRPDVGFDTLSGSLFVPHACHGINPAICRTGPLFDKRLMNCERGLITGDLTQRKQCIIKLQKRLMSTILEEIALGEYIVVSWGEKYAVQCKGQISHPKQLPLGVSILQIPESCSVSGLGWKLSGVIKQLTSVTVHPQIIVISPLKLNVTVPINHVQELLADPHWDNLDTVKKIPLSLIDPDEVIPATIDWNRHGSNLSWVTLGLIILISIPIIVVAILCYRRRMKYKHSNKSNFKLLPVDVPVVFDNKKQAAQILMNDAPTLADIQRKAGLDTPPANV